MVREPDAATQPTPQDNQLMSKHRVLSFKPCLRLEWRGQDGQSEAEQLDHPASLGDSITASHSDEVFGTHSKRGLYGAVVQSAASLGTAGILSVTLAVLLVLPTKGLDSPYVQWGWRIPFLVGAVMAFALAYYYKNSVEESEIWRKADKTTNGTAPIKMLDRRK